MFLEIRPNALKHQCWSDFRISQRFGDVVAGLQPLCWEYQWITRGYSALSESYNSELLSRVRWGCPQVRFNLDPGPSILVVQLPKPQVEKQFEDRPAVASCVHLKGLRLQCILRHPQCLHAWGPRENLFGWISIIFTHFYFFTMFDFRCSTGCPTQFDLNFHVIPWISMNSLRDLHHFTSTKHHFSPNPPQPIQDCGRSVGHVSELRKVQLSQAMRRAREQLSERLEISKMTASQLETWRSTTGWRTGCGWG